MADEVNEGIVNALDTIVTTTERSGNMKKELKQTIYENVSTLKKLFIKLIETNNSNTRAICDLEKTVANTKTELDGMKGRATKDVATPSRIPTQEPASQASHTAKGVAPSGGERLYSEALGGKIKQKSFKITISSKDNQSAETTKGLLKSKINPTEIKVGVNSLKSLKDGRILIVTGSKEEAEILTRNIRDKCGDKLEAKVQKPRDPRLKIQNIPEEISIENIEETLLAQNPVLGLKTGEIKPKFIYTIKNHTRNLVIEVNSNTRRKLLHHKVKLGWLICGIEDYMVATRCFKCSRFNHRSRDCRGTETCPMCTENHKLKDCKAQPADFKCINCHTYKLHNKNANINTNHASLDRNCPSMLAVLEKYRQNTDY
jgi:hypothetical protein